MDFFKTKYRIRPDWFLSTRYQVDKRFWWNPFWIEVAVLLRTKQKALAVIEMLKEKY